MFWDDGDGGKQHILKQLSRVSLSGYKNCLWCELGKKKS